jgi:NitT/TauT family transport system permease protein
MRLANVALPLAAGVVLVAVWWCAVHFFNVPGYVLPAPEGVLAAAWTNYAGGSIWRSVGYTTATTLGGFVLGSITGFVLGALVVQFRPLERMASPYIVAFQAMPKVALAPLLLVWFGFGFTSNVLLVALVCFFPVFVSTQVGLRSVSPELVELLHAFSASPSLIFLTIRLPSAATQIFGGLQVAAVLGLTGAVVAEFISSTVGLGHLIQTSAANLDTATMFVALFSLAALGVIMNEIVKRIHARVVFWDGENAMLSSTDATS